jgi:hypothetical protein
VYAAPSLAPGEYRIDIELSGFRPVRRAGIRLCEPRRRASAPSWARSRSCNCH